MKTLSFKTLAGKTVKGQVKNAQATLGEVASRVAAREGLAGSFELVNKRGATLDPLTTLDDLPDGEEVVLARGNWEGHRYIHEYEAIFDEKASEHFELVYYLSS